MIKMSDTHLVVHVEGSGVASTILQLLVVRADRLRLRLSFLIVVSETEVDDGSRRGIALDVALPVLVQVGVVDNGQHITFLVF